MSATTVILAAGALATPHLLLASNLTDCSPAGDAVGRYLMRHRNTLALGVFAREPNPERTFDKQIAIHDFYYGSPDWDARRGTLGGIQQLTPSVGLVRAYLPLLVRDPAAALVSHMMGLLVIAEDQPRPENRVEIAASQRDRYGLPRLRVHHAHTIRDNAAAAALAVQAKRILRTASAGLTYLHPIETFSHALGTVRMGLEPRTSPLSVYGQYRGLDNLFVTDASALPRSAGVNPSLTIAANALRIGSYIAGTPLPFAIRSRHQLPVYPSTIPAGVSG